MSMIKIPRWLIAKGVVWLLEDGCLEGETHRVYSAKDLVWLFNNIGPDDIVKYREFNFEGVNITLPESIKFHVHNRPWEYEVISLWYQSVAEHTYGDSYFKIIEHKQLGFHPNGVMFDYDGNYQ